MIDLDNLSLKQILPSNLAADETVSNITAVIEIHCRRFQRRYICAFSYQDLMNYRIIF